MATVNISEKTPIDPRPKYKDPVSSTIVSVCAAICMVAGLLMICSALISGVKDNGIILVTGIGCLVSSALLFVISNISVDIHRMEYSILSLALQNQEAQKRIIQLLEESNGYDDNQ